MCRKYEKSEQEKMWKISPTQQDDVIWPKIDSHSQMKESKSEVFIKETRYKKYLQERVKRAKKSQESMKRTPQKV